ncbi:MAG TPA: MFS transporter [Thermomicrobiales bacterium]|nr:MFS transporter [Thermomicrobiales bacterium]
MRRTVQTEAGAWGVMKVVNDAFVQPLLIAVGASQLALGLYISGSSLFNFGAGWLGPMIAGRVGSTRRFTLASLAISRTIFVLLTLYLLIWSSLSPTIIITMVLIWSIFEGFALPMWTSFLTTMVGPHERGRWIAMRAQAATLFTIPVLIGILLLVLFASKEQALPIAYGVAALGAVASWFALRRMFDLSPTANVPPARTLPRLPESAEARQFLTGTFVFWFGSALTWPIIARYLTNELGAPTAYFAITQIFGAMIGTIMQPRWGRFGDRAGARRILLVSGLGSSLVPMMWALTPVYWLGFLIDGLAFVVWPGHMLGLTLRAVELVENDDERPMMLGWTNLAQGAGACISPLLAAVALEVTSIAVVLMASFMLRMLASFILSGKIPLFGTTRVETVPAA